MSMYKVMYLPEISANANNTIRLEVSASMISPDGKTAQYLAESCLQSLDELSDDYKCISKLMNNDIEYIEIEVK